MRREELRTKHSGGRFNLLGWVVMPVILLAIWQIAAERLDQPWIFPTVTRVIEQLVHPLREHYASGSLLSNTLISLLRVLLGFVLAAVSGVALGITMGSIRSVRAGLEPIVEVLRPLCPIAWLPFAIVFFTARDFPAAAVFIIFLGIFFPILTNTVDGVKTIDPLLYDAALTLGAKRRGIFRKVVLPASIPNMMTGIRIGIGVGWMTIVAAEMTPVFSEGLGWYIWDRAEIFHYDSMFAGMLMIGIIGLVMTKSISYTERWLRR